MDSLTHVLFGAALARALPERLGKPAAALLIVASNLPDVDAPWALALGGDAMLGRRMLTHSVVGLPLLAAASALLLKPLLARGLSRRQAFGLSLLAVSLHSVLDLLNSYGVVLLYPFSTHRFELAWVFIIDLAVWALLALALLLPRGRAARACLAALSGYVLLCGAAHARAQAAVRRAAPDAGFHYAFPEPLGPHRFRGVARRDGEYKVYLLDLASGTSYLRKTLRTDAEEPAVLALRASPRARRVEGFFKAPVWLRTETGAEVYDLRFTTLVLERGTPFKYSFP